MRKCTLKLNTSNRHYIFPSCQFSKNCWSVKDHIVRLIYYHHPYNLTISVFVYSIKIFFHWPNYLISTNIKDISRIFLSIYFEILFYSLNYIPVESFYYFKSYLKTRAGILWLQLLFPGYKLTTEMYNTLYMLNVSASNLHTGIPYFCAIYAILAYTSKSIIPRWIQFDCISIPSNVNFFKCSIKTANITKCFCSKNNCNTISKEILFVITILK